MAPRCAMRSVESGRFSIQWIDLHWPTDRDLATCKACSFDRVCRQRSSSGFVNGSNIRELILPKIGSLASSAAAGLS